MKKVHSRSNALKHRVCMLVMALALYSQIYAQYPSTDIFVSRLRYSLDSVAQLLAPDNVTNHHGYDNQPYVASDGTYLLFSSQRDTNQVDIYKYNVVTKQTTQHCSTTESEFSPTIVNAQGDYTTVRIERDGRQRLWKLNVQRESASVLCESLDSVGYYCWVGKAQVALFRISQPPTLILYDTVHATQKLVSTNCGRCITMIPNSQLFSFVEKRRDSVWMICSLNPETLERKDIIQTIPSSEDYAWDTRGNLFMASESKLFVSTPATTKSWRLLADLGKFGVRSITRLTISRDNERIVFVAADSQK